MLRAQPLHSSQPLHRNAVHEGGVLEGGECPGQVAQGLGVKGRQVVAALCRGGGEWRTGEEVRRNGDSAREGNANASGR